METAEACIVDRTGSMADLPPCIADRTDETADLPGSEAKVKSSSWMADAEPSDWNHIHSAAETVDLPEVRGAGRG